MQIVLLFVWQEVFLYIFFQCKIFNFQACTFFPSPSNFNQMCLSSSILDLNDKLEKIGYEKIE